MDCNQEQSSKLVVACKAILATTSSSVGHLGKESLKWIDSRSEFLKVTTLDDIYLHEFMRRMRYASADPQIYVRVDASLSVSVILGRIMEKLDSENYKAALLCFWSIEDYKSFQNNLAVIQDIVDYEASGIRLIMAEELLRPRVFTDDIRLWLLCVSDLLFQADDVMTDFENSLWQLEQGLLSSNPLHPLLWITDFRNRLREFVTIGKLMITTMAAMSIGTLQLPTSSFVPCGQQMQEKQKIIQLLMTAPVGDVAYHVIPIVGDEGIGKTALAKLVYEDTSVQSYFDITMWIPVTCDSNILSLIQSMIHSATLEPCTSLLDTTKLHLLQAKLVRRLWGKKFLLVLDNFLNSLSCSWDALSLPFKHGARGSTIIVTTRSSRVSSIVATVPSHNVESLTLQDSLSLFETLAYGGSVMPSTEALPFCLHWIKACGWNPSVPKALGNFFGSEKIYESKSGTFLFESLSLEKSLIPSTVLMAYYRLPSHLKQCLAYCASFPKRCFYEKKPLVWMWLAEGFIENKTSTSAEEIGQSYFDELLQNSFFEPYLQNDTWRSDDRYKLSNDAQELAEIVSGDKHYRVDAQKSYVLTHYGEQSDIHCVDSTSEKLPLHILHGVRHLTLCNCSFDLGVFGYMFRPKRLHTLLIKDAASALYFTRVPDFCQKLRWLRVLDLSFNPICQLPDSIGDLQNPRYLDLSRTCIQCFPNSFTMLHNLQTLRLECLKVDTLIFPDDIGRLKNLHHLELGKGEDFGQAAKSCFMPWGIGKLVNLHALYGEVTMRELKDLKYLRTLEIKNLDGVLSMEEAKEALLWDKQYLQILRLQWRNYINPVIAKDVLTGLRPHDNLSSLKIYGYWGLKFPSWVGDHSFSKLESLRLWCCPLCEILPSLGSLQSLKHLYIRGMTDVKVVNTEFYGANRGNTFLSLITLEIVGMRSLEEWTGLQSGDMPRLRQLKIKECAKLNALPSVQFMRSLQSLHISFCPELKCLPEEGLPSSLESLTIRDCPQLSKRCKVEVGEDWHKINDISNVDIDGV